LIISNIFLQETINSAGSQAIAIKTKARANLFLSSGGVMLE
jgi:hypothetical protein